jgi:hypothetical protein
VNSSWYNEGGKVCSSSANVAKSGSGEVKRNLRIKPLDSEDREEDLGGPGCP